MSPTLEKLKSRIVELAGRCRSPGNALIVIVVLGVAVILIHRAPDFEAMPDFTTFEDTAERKARFFAYLGPIVRHHNDRIRAERAFLKGLQDKLAGSEGIGWMEYRRLRQIADRYEFDFDEESPLESLQSLLARVDIVPVELAVVQAAKESGWGRSRFAIAAYNLFGQWCYEPGCGIVPERRPAGASHEVQKFASVSSAIRHYMNNINTHPPYQKLRTIRARLRARDEKITGLALADGLRHYSERRDAYVSEVKGMIRQYRAFQESLDSL